MGDPDRTPRATLSVASEGVAGVDNLSRGAHADPPLSTVAPDPEQIGKVIAGRVVSGVNGGAAGTARLNSTFINLVELESA